MGEGISLTYSIFNEKLLGRGTITEHRDLGGRKSGMDSTSLRVTKPHLLHEIFQITQTNRVKIFLKVDLEH